MRRCLHAAWTSLAARAERIGQPCFTGFLTPPEADMALASARRQRIEARLEGGYEDAERRMACFLQPDGREEPFPIAALELTWPHQSAPGHRDVLGSVLGLGIRRSCVGDIVVLPTGRICSWNPNWRITWHCR